MSAQLPHLVMNSPSNNSMKLIRSDEDHAEALDRLKELMFRELAPDSKEAQERDLLAFLIENWEEKNIPILPPDPIEAIRFRMEQQDLKQKDLVPFIGSKSRVSEVLSGKRPLTLEMIRQLHKGLDISVEILVGEPVNELPERIDPSDYSVAQMRDRGYFQGFGADLAKVGRDRFEELLQFFFQGHQNEPLGALNRRTEGVRSKLNQANLHAWSWRVLQSAAQFDTPEYNSSIFKDGPSSAFVSELTKLSRFDQGPQLAQQALAEVGIRLIIEPHLDKTHLDGAAMLDPQGQPVIALTLRYNRLDNFWFTLFHELGHVALHLKSGTTGGEPRFLDADIDKGSLKPKEQEADQFALDSFLSIAEWQRCRSLTTATEIRREARRLSIHPAIIAGRLRREAEDYRIHRTLIGQGKVRSLFEMA